MGGIGQPPPAAHVQRVVPGAPFWTHPALPPGEGGALRRIRRRLRPFRRHFLQAIHRLGLRWNHHLRRSRPGMVVFVMADGRTGSNMLLDFLRGVPRTRVLEEILNEIHPIGLRRDGVSKGMVLRHVAWSLAHPDPWVVAKLAPWHLKSRGITYDDLCGRFPEAKFILLYRKDLGRQYVSWCRLFLTGQDRARPGDWEGPAMVTIDPAHFRAFCLNSRNTYRELLDHPGIGARSVLVSYEELVEDPQGVFDARIFGLLGMPPVTVSTGMRKQGSRSLEKAVVNFEEMRPLFESSEAWMEFPGPELPSVEGGGRSG